MFEIFGHLLLTHEHLGPILLIVLGGVLGWLFLRH